MTTRFVSLFALTILALVTLSGCGGSVEIRPDGVSRSTFGAGGSVTQIPIPDCQAKRCFVVMKAPIDLAGGGRHIESGVVETNPTTGEQVYKVHTDSAHPDRFEALINTALRVAGDVGVAKILSKQEGDSYEFNQLSSAEAVQNQESSNDVSVKNQGGGCQFPNCK